MHLLLFSMIALVVASIVAPSNVPKECRSGTVEKIKLAELPSIPALHDDGEIHDNVTMQFFIRGTEPISVNSTFCTLTKRIHKFYMGLALTTTTSYTIETEFVSADECNRWVKEKQCQYGKFQRLARNVMGTRNKPSAVYWWLTTTYENVYNCEMQETVVQKHPTSHVLWSPGADLSECAMAKRGYCQLPSKGVAVFEPAGRWFCDWLPWQNRTGSFSVKDKVWLSKQADMAVSFQSPNSKVQNGHCMDQLHQIVIADQQIGVSCDQFDLLSGELQPSFSYREKRQTKFFGTFAANRGLAANVHVTHEEHAVVHQAQREVDKRVFKVLAKDAFQFRQEEVAYLNKQARENPTAAAEHITGSPLVRASYSGGLLLVSPCQAAENVTFFPMVDGKCLREIPVEYTIDGIRKFGYLRPLDNEIRDVATPADCDDVQAFTFVQIGEKHMKYDPRTGQLSQVKPDIILPLFVNAFTDMWENATSWMGTIFQPNPSRNKTGLLPEDESNARWRVIWTKSELKAAYDRSLNGGEAKASLRVVSDALNRWMQSLGFQIFLIVVLTASIIHIIISVVRALCRHHVAIRHVV